MTTFMGLLFAERVESSNFAPLMAIVAVIAIVMNGLIWNIGLPALGMRFFKPVGRGRFYVNMVVYALLTAAIGGMWAYLNYRFVDLEMSMPEDMLRVLVTVYIAENVLTPLIFGSIACVVLADTRSVDKPLPLRFHGARAVKALVTETDPLTAVEYEGKRYVLSKSFRVRLRDKIKVRIIEDEEKAYLK